MRLELEKKLLEMDYEFGTVMDALRGAGVYEDTLVLVTGDNGPWECKCELTGVALQRRTRSE